MFSRKLSIISEYLIKCNNPVAIGECGLDYARDIDRKQQRHFFVSQLELAQKYDLPIIIHAVKSTVLLVGFLRCLAGVWIVDW
jgi:TatD DNase family protein